MSHSYYDSRNDSKISSSAALAKTHPPIIFLDIDGVLNTQYAGGFIQVTDTHMQRLKVILDHESEPVIVLSTYWRGFSTYIKYIFSQYDIPSNRIVGTTVHGLVKDAHVSKYHENQINLQPRHVLINDWLLKYNLHDTPYVIIDDRPKAAKGKEQLSRFVHTTTSLGLTDDNVQQALKILVS